MSQIYRLHYRAQLNQDYEEAELVKAVEGCTVNIRNLQKEGRILTAALYRTHKMLFLYYEAIDESKATDSVEKAEGEVSGNGVLDNGEDVQLNIVYPTAFLEPLSPFLQIWPGHLKDRLWVHMYHIFYHCRPESIEQWRRKVTPEKRRGRIAFLRDSKLFSYTYFHKAIVDEGLLMGDKYQSIALHENILFSYFEEPKQETNVKNQPGVPSKVIQDWLAADPESHFVRMLEGQTGNFVFIPALFALGEEDLEK